MQLCLDLIELLLHLLYHRELGGYVSLFLGFQIFFLSDFILSPSSL